MSDHGSEGGHAMAMYFTTERPPRLVFESWSIEQDLDYNLACVILFALSAFSLWLRVYRGNSEARLHGARSNGRQVPLQARVTVTGLYAVEVFVGYVLMLAVMTYNKGLFAAVLLGACTGHFLFAIEAAAHRQDLLACHN